MNLIRRIACRIIYSETIVFYTANTADSISAVQNTVMQYIILCTPRSKLLPKNHLLPKFDEMYKEFPSKYFLGKFLVCRENVQVFVSRYEKV